MVCADHIGFIVVPALGTVCQAFAPLLAFSELLPMFSRVHPAGAKSSFVGALCEPVKSAGPRARPEPPLALTQAYRSLPAPTPA